MIDSSTSIPAVSAAEPAPSPVTEAGQRVRRFDQLLLAVIATLLIAIGVTIAGGDRAGVGISLLDLDGNPVSGSLTLPSGRPIQIRFSEAMATDSVHIHLTPNLPFTQHWAGTTLLLTPLPALTAGISYRLTLDAGIHALSGRQVVQPTVWPITVEPLRVIFMAPAIPTPLDQIVNLWLVTADGSGTPVKLTQSTYGIEDFAVSPDGRTVAYSQRDAHGKTDLFLLTIADDSSRQITHCVDSPCRAPSWNPDGRRLLYERADSTATDSAVRAWLLDLTTLQTTPLFADSQWLGQTPRWSADGRTISVYDKHVGGIFIVDAASGDRSLIQTLEDDAGLFAPGQRQELAFRQLVTTKQGAMRQLAVADYSDHAIRSLPAADGALTDDPVAIWQPDGKRLTVMRRYFDQRGTEGSQVYSVNAQTGESTPLVVDAAYTHGALSWSPDGGQLLMQRYPMVATGTAQSQTSLWRYDVATKSLRQLATNGFLPQWLP